MSRRSILTLILCICLLMVLPQVALAKYQEDLENGVVKYYFIRYYFNLDDNTKKYYTTNKVIRFYINKNQIPIQKMQPQLQPKFKPIPARTKPQSQQRVKLRLIADEQKMVELVNQERRVYGLPELKLNMDLVKVARLKAEDMIKNDYFSHTSPTYGNPFKMMRQFGISYRSAGENLAGAPTVEIAHKSLMNSSSHRANILNSSFTEIGIGVAQGNTYSKIFVQMFIGR